MIWQCNVVAMPSSHLLCYACSWLAIEERGEREEREREKEKGKNEKKKKKGKRKKEKGKRKKEKGKRGRNCLGTVNS